MEDAGDARQFEAALAAARRIGETGGAGLVAGALAAMALAALGLWAWRRWAASHGRPTHELPLGRLLLRFAVAFAGVVFAAAAFAELADELGEDPRVLGRIDDAYADALRGALGADAARAFGLVTHLADTWTLTALAVVVAVGLVAAGRRGLAAAWVATVAGQGLLTLALKAVFARVRPLHDGRPPIDGWSFPSGHTVGAVVAYGMLAYLAFRLLPHRFHLPALLVAAALAWLIGVSRIVLRVHHPSDVLAGFAAGAVWLVASVAVVEGMRWRYGRRPTVTAG